MKETILQIHDLSCGYDKKTILHDITFSVDSGEIISIIGPNGSGKTTLLRAVTNLLKPEKGKVLLHGTDVRKIPPRKLAKTLAVVMQSVENSFMTVEEYILLGRIPYFGRYQFFETKSDIALAHQYMELTDTLKHKDSPMNEISGGERQLAAIARALVQEPSLLLLDEPTSHLDITHQVQILELIRRLNRELSLSVLMVIHDLNLASEFSDKVVLFNQNSGTVYRTGTPKEVLTENAIQAVYNTRVRIQNNPVSGKPWIFLTTD